MKIVFLVLLACVLLIGCSTSYGRSARVSQEQISLSGGTLMVENLDGARIVTFKGDTHSMEPTISNTTRGALVPANITSLQVGDIIGFHSIEEGVDYAHRIVGLGVDERGWYAETKGDNQGVDNELVRRDNVLGVVVALIY